MNHLEINLKPYKMPTIKPKLSDFTFLSAGHGHYRVSYTSTVTGKTWTRVISDMELIDATKNAENPRVNRLEDLKRTVKF